MSGVIEGEGGSLVDGHSSRFGGRIRSLACVQLQRLELLLPIVRHGGCCLGGGGKRGGGCERGRLEFAETREQVVTLRTRRDAAKWATSAEYEVYFNYQDARKCDSKNIFEDSKKLGKQRVELSPQSRAYKPHSPS